jgi:hypothetical protein
LSLKQGMQVERQLCPITVFLGYLENGVYHARR